MINRKMVMINRIRVSATGIMIRTGSACMKIEFSFSSATVAPCSIIETLGLNNQNRVKVSTPRPDKCKKSGFPLLIFHPILYIASLIRKIQAEKKEYP